MKSLDSDTPRNAQVVQPLFPKSQSSLGCAACFEGKASVFGANSNDGIVSCAQCGAPRFYCDLGGQG